MAYGVDDTSASTPATAGTGADELLTTEAGLYTFASLQAKVIVHNHPDSGSVLYIIYNGATAGAASRTSWDTLLEAKDYAVSPDGIGIRTVAIYNLGATVTYETDFNVRGWAK